MPGKATTIFALSTVLVSVQVAAMPTYVAKIPNGANVDGVQALGHVDPEGGGARNAFGTAFGAGGHTWTKELCEADSDGDGQTNGQELGDPCCAWVESSNDVVLWSKGLSHPGLASSKSDPSLWASVSCGSASSSAGSSTANSTTTTVTATTTPSTTTATPSTTTAAPAATTAAPSSAATSTSTFTLISAMAVVAAAVFA
uniref:Temptin Cys/Cys disulfide domain-containing protein n=1 Tax=Globisporangium ultimum (strain ATCC 200006 / CBS 805.95 / DAOM BR144) TaxID=431595 RepID=K3X1D7_GLOUD